MKKTGAQLVAFALEEIGVKWTFGIPGVHNTEIYDELNKSEKITPILVTHELSASFMADAISRVSNSIGCAVIVPAAGATHAMSGIGEAYLDGIATLIISGGIRRDTGKSFQLHDVDQEQLVKAVTKKYFLIQNHATLVSTIYQAYDLATSGTPGPVFIEIPGDIQLFAGEVEELPRYQSRKKLKEIPTNELRTIAQALKASAHPGIYLGWGARHATREAIELAELLGAPVATTLQGLSVFPANHPLHTGMGFGKSSVPAAEKAFADCDCLLTVGARFSELGTGSFGLPVPVGHIHIDINKEVFNKNYPAVLTLEADALMALGGIVKELRELGVTTNTKPAVQALKDMIAKEKTSYFHEWSTPSAADRVGPGPFFQSLRRQLEADCYLVVDDGNHTFLSEELFPVYESCHFISPTDYNAMGYCVPATIATKLANPKKDVVGIVGDGAFLMTAMELITATTHSLGVVMMVFHDGELGQISQFQQIPLNRKTCTILGDIKIQGLAMASGCAFLEINSNQEIDRVIAESLKLSRQGRAVIVDVKVDYSKKTRFTQGVVKTNLQRFPLGEKVRFIGRAVKRHILG